MTVAQSIWDKVQSERKFQMQPPAVREATRPFIEAMPNILAEMLEKPVNLENLLQAKIKVLRYCLEHGFIGIMVDAMPDDIFLFGKDSAKSMMEATLSRLIDTLEPIVTAVPEFLKAQGLTEEQIMLSPEAKLNEEMQALYKSGQLTIGRLLEEQPMAIFDNTPD